MWEMCCVNLKCFCNYRPQGKVMFSRVSVCPRSASWILVHCSALLHRGRYASYWNAFLLEFFFQKLNIILFVSFLYALISNLLFIRNTKNYTQSIALVTRNEVKMFQISSFETYQIKSNKSSHIYEKLD